MSPSHSRDKHLKSAWSSSEEDSICPYKFPALGSNFPLLPAEQNKNSSFFLFSFLTQWHNAAALHENPWFSFSNQKKVIFLSLTWLPCSEHPLPTLFWYLAAKYLPIHLHLNGSLATIIPSGLGTKLLSDTDCQGYMAFFHRAWVTQPSPAQTGNTFTHNITRVLNYNAVPLYLIWTWRLLRDPCTEMPAKNPDSWKLTSDIGLQKENHWRKVLSEDRQWIRSVLWIWHLRFRLVKWLPQGGAGTWNILRRGESSGHCCFLVVAHSHRRLKRVTLICWLLWAFRINFKFF